MCQQVGKFLDDLVRRRDQKVRVRRVLGIRDEKAAGALADPLGDARVAGAADERVHAVERVLDAAVVGRGGCAHL